VTDPRTRRAAGIAILVVAALAALFVAAVFATPWLDTRGSSAAIWLRFAYAPLCHQMPERSLDLAGASLAVCARCTGLYLGGLAGIVLGLWFFRHSRRPRPMWLAWAAAPTVVDVLLSWIGLPGLPGLPRMLLALVPGAVAGIFLALAVAELACRSGNSKLEDSVRAARA